LLYLDQTGVQHWTFGQSTTTTNPTGVNGNRMLVGPSFDTVRAQPLIQNYFMPLTSKAIYDWSEINLSAPNRVDDKSRISSVLLDQTILATTRQQLAVQLGWFREDSDRNARNIYAGTSGIASAIQIDVNERWMNGQPNPNFLRPF